MAAGGTRGDGGSRGSEREAGRQVTRRGRRGRGGVGDGDGGGGGGGGGEREREREGVEVGRRMIGLSEEVRRYKSSAQGFFHAEPARECETFFACAQPRLGGGREGAPTTRARPQREIAWGSGRDCELRPAALRAGGRACVRTSAQLCACRPRAGAALLRGSGGAPRAPPPPLRSPRAPAAGATSADAAGRGSGASERAGGLASEREPASGGAASGARGGRRCRPIAASAHPPPCLPPLSAACCPAAVPPPPRARGPPCSFLVSPLPRPGCRPRRSSSRWRCRRRC